MQGPKICFPKPLSIGIPRIKFLSIIPPFLILLEETELGWRSRFLPSSCLEVSQLLGSPEDLRMHWRVGSVQRGSEPFQRMHWMRLEVPAFRLYPGLQE